MRLYEKTTVYEKSKERVRTIMNEFDDKLLDLGCGTGLVYDLINPTNYVGVDINKDYLEYFKRKSK